ncbi:MAG TPA: polysaccharide deacetylase family protein [Polyangiaceae bacterium]|nr:polysaccharide deacetylase family protein [Polyangiaceae bacterium]
MRATARLATSSVSNLELGLPFSTRQGAKALAQAMLPSSMVTWRGPVARSAAQRKAVALTFDDGPTSLTPEYLRVLDQLGVRATFFVIGKACTEYPHLVRAIASHGHQLANHGYTHRRFTTLSSSELEQELQRTQDLLDTFQAPQHRLVRPPHGATSLWSMLNCSLAGFTTVLWSFDSGDSRTRNVTDLEQAFTVNTVNDGDIILLHEGQSWTLQALPAIVNELEKTGHDLVTLGELLD